MKKESLLYRFLKWIGLVKAYEVNKKTMCENAKSVCNGNCESCAWGE